MSYALFIGRWRTFHDGHLWLIRQKLDAGVPVLIGVRPTTHEEPDPRVRVGQIVERMLAEGYAPNRDFKVFLLLVDIESINYGRGVGYDVIKHEPPEEIAAVSSTELLS